MENRTDDDRSGLRGLAIVLDVLCSGGWNPDRRNPERGDQLSMNLHAEYDGVDAELWQTPTQVTYDCMTVDGKVFYSLEGDKAREVLDKYAEWVKSRCSDPDTVSYHLDHIEIVKRAKELEVFIL